MFNVGDYFLYSSQGICQIDSMSDCEINGVSRRCYIFHPLKNEKARIITPVDNEKVRMRAVILKKEAEDIMRSFGHALNLSWDINKKTRYKMFSDAITSTDPADNAEILKLLILKKEETVSCGKKLPLEDERILGQIRQNLVDELSVALDSSTVQVTDYINNAVNNLVLS